jgi:cytochrome c556
MKLIKLLVAFSATVMFFVLLAQSDADYSGWMKSAVAAKGKVAKGIAAKDGPGVATDAKIMEDSVKGIEDYWTKKGVADASGFAKTARVASADVAKAAKAGDFDAAGAALTVVGGTCQGCHMAHRAKGADGAFQIK